MTQKARAPRPASILRQWLDTESASGIVLMLTAALALLVANSPLADGYFRLLEFKLGPLSTLHWINDALMAMFFLLVGLEIKREFLDGQLASWSNRALPGIAATGGVVVPALIFAWFNWSNPETIKGWAIPSATDIAFALGVLSLLGPRVPTSLKVFLATLAILDDLAAVAIIAVFYTADLAVLYLALAAAVFALMIFLNKRGVMNLTPYMLLGLILWYLVFSSGVHATVAGVLTALTIPIKSSPAKPDDTSSPLHILEHAIAKSVSFIVVPIFGFANAGVSFAGMDSSILREPLTLGIALGLFVGKQIGVFGFAWLAIIAGIATRPAGASWTQLYGVALLCGIGFTMSLFIGLLSFDNILLHNETKIGVLMGSIVSAIAGYTLLRLTSREANPGHKQAI